MKRVSSCLTVPQKILGIILALGFFVGAYVSERTSLIPCVLFLLAGIAVLVVWWRYVLPAPCVLMNDGSLYVRRRGVTTKIPFNKFIEVRKPRFVKNPPLIISYENEAGEHESVILIPSIRQNGMLFGERKLENLLTSKARKKT